MVGALQASVLFCCLWLGGGLTVMITTLYLCALPVVVWCAGADRQLLAKRAPSSPLARSCQGFSLCAANSNWVRTRELGGFG